MPSGLKTIDVDWADATAEERETGVFGSLLFTISLPLVYIRAHLKSGRFWADSMLLKLGRFTDTVVVFDHGKVHSRIRVTFERTGAYLAIETLDLAVEKIRIESMSDHSRRWGVLLGTVSGLQWLLSGFLERKLLNLISAAVVSENQRQQLFQWSEISFLNDLETKMQHYQRTAAMREMRERRAVRTLQARLRQHRAARRHSMNRRVSLGHIPETRSAG